MLATGYTMTENSSTCLKLPKIKLVSKGNYQNIKRQNTEWGNIFVNDISDESLICKIYKELIQLNTHTQKPSKTTAKTVKNWADDLKRLFSKGDM